MVVEGDHSLLCQQKARLKFRKLVETSEKSNLAAHLRCVPICMPHKDIKAHQNYLKMRVLLGDATRTMSLTEWSLKPRRVMVACK